VLLGYSCDVHQTEAPARAKCDGIMGWEIALKFVFIKIPASMNEISLLIYAAASL
jgi:hypothetical protein